jgi:hypothetical protein
VKLPLSNKHISKALNSLQSGKAGTQECWILHNFGGSTGIRQAFSEAVSSQIMILCFN